jgi:hypothetical protein
MTDAGAGNERKKKGRQGPFIIFLRISVGLSAFCGKKSCILTPTS